MCAINPTHKKRFVLDVYTAEQGISDAEFVDMVLNRALEAEQQLNASGKLRWHIKESEQETD